MSPKKKLDHKIVFIPPWVTAVQSTYNLPDTDLVSLAPLLDILTLEDVSFYYACIEIFKTHSSFRAFTDTFDTVDLFENTRSSAANKTHTEVEPNDTKQFGFVNSVNIENILKDVTSNAQLMKETIKLGLGHTNNMDSAVATMEHSLSQVDCSDINCNEHVRHNYVFEMLPIDNKYIGVRFAKADAVTRHRDCFKQCIQTLCEMYSFETVAQTSVFSSWTGIINV